MLRIKQGVRGTQLSTGHISDPGELEGAQAQHWGPAGQRSQGCMEERGSAPQLPANWYPENLGPGACTRERTDRAPSPTLGPQQQWSRPLGA